MQKRLTVSIQLSALLPILLLAGCIAPVTDPNSPFYMPLPGSKVIIHQRLEVPPGHTRVFLQHGKVVAKRRLNRYAVNCNFEINRIADTPRYIEPGSYIISRTIRDMEEIVQHGPIKLASLSVAMSGTDDNGDTPMMFEIVRMSLKGENTPDIRELACRGVLDDLPEMEMPRLAEMRQALGVYASIDIGGEVVP